MIVRALRRVLVPRREERPRNKLGVGVRSLCFFLHGTSNVLYEAHRKIGLTRPHKSAAIVVLSFFCSFGFHVFEAV